MKKAELTTKTPADAKPVLCEGLECPDCGGCMEQRRKRYYVKNY